jgi:hypothetical protein
MRSIQPDCFAVVAGFASKETLPASPVLRIGCADDSDPADRKPITIICITRVHRLDANQAIYIAFSFFIGFGCSNANTIHPNPEWMSG